MDPNSINKTHEIVPEQLTITIINSIPGYQKVQYIPSMTIPESDSRTILFNPLIKLKQSIVSKVPPEYRINQFFKPDLFQSLINYTGSKPAKNLLTATRLGYVDNNIKVTLNTLFPVNSVIYIGDQIYTILDVQWTNADWKIGVTEIGGDEQLKKLPKVLLVGSNYSGSKTNDPVKTNEKKDQNKLLPNLNKSKLTYAITIYMELHPGTTLSKQQINDSKCNSKYNAIKKAYSDLTGQPYIVSPVYKKKGGNRNKTKGGVRSVFKPLGQSALTIGKEYGKDWLKTKSMKVAEGIYQDPNLIKDPNYMLYNKKPISIVKPKFDIYVNNENDENVNPNIIKGGKISRKKYVNKRKTRRRLRKV